MVQQYVEVNFNWVRGNHPVYGAGAECGGQETQTPRRAVQPEGAGSNYIEFRSYKPIKANYVKSPANRN